MIKISDEILLRPFRFSDATFLAKHANNINIWKNLTDLFPHPYTIEHAMDFITLQKDIDPPEVFAIVFKDEAVGAIRLAIDKNNTKLCGDIGYWVGEIYWNRGIATSAIEAIIKYGFETYKNVCCLSAYVYTNNPASIRALEKAGFKKVKTMKDSIPKDGKKMDVHYYVINRK